MYDICEYANSCLIRIYFCGFSCIPLYYIYTLFSFDGLEEQPLKAAIINVFVVLLAILLFSL